MAEADDEIDNLIAPAFSRRAPFAPIECDVTEADLAAGALQPYLVDLTADHDTRLRWVKLRNVGVVYVI